MRLAGDPLPVGWRGAFGCTGGNQPIRLFWHSAPAGTRSHAVTITPAAVTAFTVSGHILGYARITAAARR